MREILMGREQDEAGSLGRNRKMGTGKRRGSGQVQGMS